MKVNGLEGDYCPTCAGALEAHKTKPQRVIVLCGSVCGSVFNTSGDIDRLDPVHVPVKVVMPVTRMKMIKRGKKKS